MGAKLKAERASQGYKRHDTRQKINKRDLQLFRYEHGINKIDLDTLINYCHALTLDIHDFLGELQAEKNHHDTSVINHEDMVSPHPLDSVLQEK